MWNRTLCPILIAILLTANLSADADEPAAQTAPLLPRKERLELMNRVFSEFELQFADDTENSLPRTKDPVLRWSNPVRNSFSDGAIYFWLNDARPIAIVTISIRDTGSVWREFSTLAVQPLQATRDGKVVWNPQAAELALKLLTDAPRPAPSLRLRLSQMRKIAAQFRITMFEGEKKRDEFKDLRLLPQPIYQWSSKAPALSHGAVFAFCETTDPEAVLVLELYAENEADQPAWRYSLARMTSRPLTFYRNDRELGAVKGYWAYPRTSRDPFVEVRMKEFETGQ